MDVELITGETSEDDNYGVDYYSEDYSNYEGERCGICMDVVVDRGVLDCCQHWFCFACIDNWATITSLCPLCQNEFQLITCVPVYDIVGGSKSDDETNPRDDDWFIEGKTNTVSFPSYYIDENAVVCLDGDGCKIRSESVVIEEDSDIDTSIACDSCDKWYHAFCVGFDPEGTCESSWLCPRCTVDKGSESSDRSLVLRNSYQSCLEIGGGDYPAEASFSGRVSVSLADDAETAIVISLVEENQDSEESGKSVMQHGIDMENTFISSSTSNMSKSESLPDYANNLEHKSCQHEMGLSLPQDNCFTSTHSLSPVELKISADDTVERAPTHLNNKVVDTALGLDIDLSTDVKVNNLAADHEVGPSKANNRTEDLLPAEKMVHNEMETFPIKSMMSDEKAIIHGTPGAKRKHENIRYADDGEIEANIEAKFSRKKIKAESNSQPINLTNEAVVSSLDDSDTVSSQSKLRGSKYKRKSEKESGISDIMDILQETDRRSLKQLKHQNSSDKRPNERESAAGLRLKKIMRRPADNKDSSELVQELRKKIREAVRNKSSIELGPEHFDPKLLNAFRATLAGTGAENRKPTVDVRAKKLYLQKGKVRENLTKKIYGTGGKRQRAWTRECEVEFWKHRCTQTSKPEKIQALKSVLDILRANSGDMEKMPGNEQEKKGSILSRLYLADTSVFPRKNDIQPVAVHKAVASPDQKKPNCLIEKASDIQSDRNAQHNTSFQVIVPSLETKKTIKDMKSEIASSDAQLKHPKGTPPAAVGGTKIPSVKDMTTKPDTIKGDKRKWAMDLLARKTAASGKNMQEKEEDNKILKGNYALLAQLPKDMRPVLAPSRHNKIPSSVRQAQLYRLTEHFLKKANLSVVSRSAETELAVADAVNIEKEVANRSNSKLVYLNLCSQELLRRSDDAICDRAKELNPSTSECLSVEAPEETNDSSLDLAVDEALRKAGLMSDSPPNSPDHQTDYIDSKVGSLEDTDKVDPDNVIEVDSHPDLDIYGDFEYSLEDDDFIGAGSLNISKVKPQEPKMKVLFSSLTSEKSDASMNLPDFEVHGDAEALTDPSDLLEAQNKTSTEGSTVEDGTDDNDKEPSVAECEELYGPDKESLIEKLPETTSITPFELGGENESKQMPSDSGRPSMHRTDNLVAASDESKQMASGSDKKEGIIKNGKTSKCDADQSERHCVVVKMVEAYIKEHIRPLCKSGVITVEQYRWAVGKTTEKVMKYHSKEKNANFLIKEGEKVKKLAEQYAEAAQTTKSS
ncbi:hypothetical protein ACS0TY_022377 [Phlomoides rotata]